MAGRETGMIPMEMTRLGILMTPDPDLPGEAEGVMNPAAARGPDGDLYIFPRCVSGAATTRRSASPG